MREYIKRTPKVCRHCKQLFYPSYGRQNSSNYCSRKCYLVERWGASRTRECKCLNCGGIYQVFLSEIKRKFCSPKCKIEYQVGKPFTENIKQFMSIAHKAREWTPKRKAQFDEARKHRNFGEETRAKLRAKRMTQKPQPHTNTSIEIILQKTLSEVSISYQLHQPVCGVCIPDIVIPEAKFAIFADGDYWHNRPEVKARDIKHNSILLKQGWLPIRISEASILADVALCVRQIQDHLTTTFRSNRTVFL